MLPVPRAGGAVWTGGCDTLAPDDGTAGETAVELFRFARVRSSPGPARSLGECRTPASGAMGKSGSREGAEIL